MMFDFLAGLGAVGFLAAPPLAGAAFFLGLEAVAGIAVQIKVSKYNDRYGREVALIQLPLPQAVKYDIGIQKEMAHQRAGSSHCVL